MQATKIEWCDATWNPVTGCLHGCDYCYAKKITERFGGVLIDIQGEPNKGMSDTLHDLQEPKQVHRNRKVQQAPFPYSFLPTFHRYRLNEPQKKKKPQNIFVCSMADLFGKWVPDKWIERVFEACKKAPQHRYIFLTKNYRRYNELREKEILPLDKNMYFGASVTNEKSLKQACLFWDNIDFLSIEPLSGYLGFEEWSIDGDLKPHWKWVIVGAETGNRKDKIIPEEEWVRVIYSLCRRMDIPVFIKNSLSKITWQGKLANKFGKPPQEFPWGAK
jgi:protein gp37